MRRSHAYGLGGVLGVLTAGVLASRLAGCATAKVESIAAAAALVDRHALVCSSESSMFTNRF